MLGYAPLEPGERPSPQCRLQRPHRVGVGQDQDVSAGGITPPAGTPHPVLDVQHHGASEDAQGEPADQRPQRGKPSLTATLDLSFDPRPMRIHESIDLVTRHALRGPHDNAGVVHL